MPRNSESQKTGDSVVKSRRFDANIRGAPGVNGGEPIQRQNLNLSSFPASPNRGHKMDAMSRVMKRSWRKIRLINAIHKTSKAERVIKRNKKHSTVQ
jgi:hypothetical protein